VDIAPMTKSQQIQNILLLIEFVDNAVITGAQPIFKPTFKPVMGVIRSGVNRHHESSPRSDRGRAAIEGGWRRG